MLIMSHHSIPDTLTIENILIKTELLKIDDEKSLKKSNIKLSPSSSSTKSGKSELKGKRRSSRRIKKPIKRLGAVIMIKSDRKSRPRKSNNPVKLEQQKNLESLIVNIMKRN